MFDPMQCAGPEPLHRLRPHHELWHERKMEIGDVQRAQRLPERRPQRRGAERAVSAGPQSGMVEGQARDGSEAGKACRRRVLCDRFPALNRAPIVSDQMDGCVGARCVRNGEEVLDEVRQAVAPLSGWHVRCAGPPDVVGDDVEVLGKVRGDQVPDGTGVGETVHAYHCGATAFTPFDD